MGLRRLIGAYGGIVAQETKKKFEVTDGLLGFSTGVSPVKSLQAKVGEKPSSPPEPPPETVSDSRLKTDIRQVGTTAHDLPLYTFRYIGEDGHYEGVMAQDVLKVMPEAVSVGEDGYYRVNQAMLGIELRYLGKKAS